MKSKEANFNSKVFSKDELNKLLPVTNPEHSDSANLDGIVEMLVLDGRPLEHVLMMLVPEAWQDNSMMDKDRKAFYKYHASIMEPWDGPACIDFYRWQKSRRHIGQKWFTSIQILHYEKRSI